MSVGLGANGKESWPTNGEFREAVQRPDLAFLSPELRGMIAERNKMGVIRTRAGAFANVYKMINPANGKAKAVRVFLYPNSSREDRYREVDTHLRQRRPRCLINFSYHKEGIRVGQHKKVFPIQVMDWVEGKTLGTWLADRIARGEAVAIRTMASRWIELIEDLTANQIAHGDLQHGNVMVLDSGAPVLVDYDCLCVPSLAGQVAFESGMPAYQHPGRSGQPLSLEMDRFSAWVILLALRALAADMGLWKKFVEEKQNENILFQRSDLDNPKASGLWPRLLTSPDPDVRDFATLVKDALGRPFDQVPPPELNIWSGLEKACAARPIDWDALAAQAAAPKLAGRPVRADLVAPVAEAKKRVAARDALRAVLKARDVRAVQKAFAPALFDDWKAQEALARQAREAIAAVPLLDQLAGAVDTPRLPALWAQHRARLAGIPEADAFGQKAEAWGRRDQALQDLASAVARGAEGPIAAAWAALKRLGGHPDADRYRVRAELAARRVEALRRLAALPAGDSEVADRQAVAAWDDDLFRGCPEADPWRDQARVAQARLKRLGELSDLLTRVDRGQATGVNLAAGIRAANLTAAYSAALGPRLAAATARLEAERRLAEALARRPPSDLELAEAWQRARAAKLPLPVDPALLSRCEQATRRAAAIKRLQSIPAGQPEDQFDARLLAEWDEPLLRGCADAASLRNLWTQARERSQAAAEFDRALLARDPIRVKDLIGQPCLVGYPPVQARMAEALELIRVHEKISGLIAALQAGDHATVARLFGRKILEDHAEALVPYRGLIEGWVRDYLLRPPDARSGRPTAKFDPGRGAVRVTWPWVADPLVVAYRLLLHPGGFAKTPADQDGTMDIRRADYQRAEGAHVPVFTPARRLYVTLWPVADLGWGRVTGPPQAVGPIELGGQEPSRPRGPRPGGSWWTS